MILTIWSIQRPQAPPKRPQEAPDDHQEPPKERPRGPKEGPRHHKNTTKVTSPDVRPKISKIMTFQMKIYDL